MNKVRSTIAFEKLTGPAIELPSDQGPIDLHAYMSFMGFSYSVDRTLVLQWDVDHARAVKVKDGYVASMKLTFVGVDSFATTPRDPKVPFEADQNLEDFEVHRSGGSIEMTLNFNGGVTLRVQANDAFADLTLENGGGAVGNNVH